MTQFQSENNFRKFKKIMIYHFMELKINYNKRLKQLLDQKIWKNFYNVRYLFNFLLYYNHYISTSNQFVIKLLLSL